MTRYRSLEFVRLCCVKCRRESVSIAFWAGDPERCNHGASCPWGDGVVHPACNHGSLPLELVS